ncbi:MAG: ABC transporter substrate-binding protein [Gemmatimonadetes bacterium]|nr:ABC transporter substrate-binding protein [Gemmatimonadota bacterium]
MFNRTVLIAVSFAAAVAVASAQGGFAQYIEPPFLTRSVAMGDLLPVEKRLPANPAVADLAARGLSPGKYGGTLRLLMGRARDTRMMVIYGYARLVAYNPEFEIVPDILERAEVKDGRIFTLHLRQGHKWSDGRPFTSEDFRYYWEDVANNRELSPGGPHKVLLVDGELPRFEVVDETTVRYSWSKPNPHFLPKLAAASPLFIYRPAHYLKRFHNRYTASARLAVLAERMRFHNWAALHDQKDNQYRFDNPDLPTLQPWINLTRGPSQRFVFTRNPYYHRVDTEGRQLPYIDRVIMQIASSMLVPAKTAAGESDLQARNIQFSDYTFLKASAKRSGYTVRLWRSTKGAHLALYPNLNVKDPEWRQLLRDVRFRRALSLAIDRHEINQVLYYGLALEGNNSVLPQSPLYRPEYRDSWAKYDLKRANALLDELGLTKRNSQGIRLLPDGRPMELIVETAGRTSEQADNLELVRDTWLKIGIKLFTKPSQREVFRNRVMSGETLISIWSGLDSGLANPLMDPAELAPSNQYQLQWPKWGRYYETNGKAGTEPDLPAVKELVELHRAWLDATSRKQREDIWHKMLEIHAREVFTIGLIGGVPQPVVVNKKLKNVPDKGLYGWSSTAYFGIYKPDSFWFEPGRDFGPKRQRVERKLGQVRYPISSTVSGPVFPR